VFKKKTDAAVKAKFVPEAALKRKRGIKCNCGRLKLRAFKSVKGIEQDIRELFGVSRVSSIKREWTRMPDYVQFGVPLHRLPGPNA
jgi:hypothetical protein